MSGDSSAVPILRPEGRGECAPQRRPWQSDYLAGRQAKPTSESPHGAVLEADFALRGLQCVQKYQRECHVRRNAA